MPSILWGYENVYFIAGHPFLYNGVQYNKGDKVPDAKNYGNLESLVRSRRLVPVVDSYSEHAPLQFRHEVKQRDLALRKLGLDPEQETSPPPDAPPEPDYQATANQFSENQFTSSENEYNPGKHGVREVLTYVDEHPDELLSVYALEEEGRKRPTLLKKLDDRLNLQVEEETP